MPARRRPVPLAALLAALVALAACGDEKPARGEPCGQGPRAYDAIAYALSAHFDWDTGRLAATEEITLAVCPGAGGRVLLDSAVDVSAVHAGGTALTYTADAAAETLLVELGPLAGRTEPVTFTVEYASSGVFASTSTESDPVRSRVAFTDSEPRDGHRWLVEKDDPSDPARFSVTLEVGPGEDAIANGERVIDEPLPGGGRRIGHALDVPVATYLMAFAVGELEHAERTYRSTAAGGRDVPLALWWRRGLAVEPGDNLDAVEEAMARFEALLGPYPFDRYTTVLLPPPFGGGMENATVTFNGEGSGQGWVSFSLNAHELAHHWFGDWVTMRTYDDVWVKEGMATLLAAEASRGTRDLEERGRLMGVDFAFDPDDAIVDPALQGIAKYTSGPYTRAATLITEIRARIGEAAFWSSCRALLAARPNGSVTGEEFVRSFSPHLDEPTIRAVLAQLAERAVPAWEVTATPVQGGTDVSLRVTNPGGGALLSPIDVTTVDAAGAPTVVALAPGATQEVHVPSGGYLALDERERRVHDEADDALASLLAPSGTGPAADTFLSRSAGHQERALLRTFVGMTPAELPGLLAALDSDAARRYALRAACSWNAGAGPEWQAALVAALSSPPVVRYDPALHGLCGAEIGAAFEAELLALEASPAPADLDRLEYLLSFRFGPDGTAAVQRLRTSAPSLELRQIATSRANRDTPPPPGAGARALAADAAGGPQGEEGKALRRAP